MQNVSEFMQGRKTNLYEKVLENSQVAGLLMALLSNLVIVCHKRGTPIEGLSFDAPREANGDVTGRIHFNSLSIPSVYIWEEGASFKSYVAQYGRNLYKCLEKNPRIGKFFEQLVDVLEKYGRRKGIAFPDVSFKKAIITQDDVFVMKMGRETLDKWSR